ncbi:MAG: hypothetical protein Q9160_001646 [Pyrenula sp. 1 TL-2023]
MADPGDERLRRTSSQLSTASTKSNKGKPTRTRPRKSLSNASTALSTNLDPSLTSFPSLSPENTPEARRHASQIEDVPQPNRTVSQKVKHRKATLAGLTNASPSLNGRALFDDSPRSSSEVPGALHLATDEHIERLLARSGAVKLVRQFAQDLAHRDAELSALRRRADERERELKRILREAGVPTVDIEQRLRSVDSSPEVSDNDRSGKASRRNGTQKVTSSIDSLMHDAMHDDVGVADGAIYVDGSPQSIQQINGGVDGRSSRLGFETSRKRTGSVKSWQDYIWGSSTTSRGASGASSIASNDQDDADATARPRNPSGAGRRKGLENLFSPSAQSQPSSYFIGGAKKPSRKPSVAESMGSQAKKTSRTISTWTKIFAGNPQAGKDASEQNTVRGRTDSGIQGQADDSRAASLASGRGSAAMSRVTSNQSSKLGPLTSSGGAPKPNSQTVRRAIQSSGALASSPDASRSDANLGPVEMDAILPTDSKPPTMRHTYSNYDTKGLLTDRFGFIYDQRQRKRQREAAMAVKESKRKSFVDSLNSFRTDSDVEAERESLKGNKSTGATSPADRPSSPTSTNDLSEPTRSSRWQDYLRIATRPTELLSHTPSTGPLVSLTIADTTASPLQVSPFPLLPTPTSPAQSNRTRGNSLSIDSRKGTTPIVSVNPEPSTSEAMANKPEFSANSGSSIAPSVPSSLQQQQQEPVKMLLDQLIDLHDSLQAEKTIKWNEFLRKVRAERGAAAAASTGPDNKTMNMPEASFVDGEMIGVSNLGHKGKLGRAKWKEFKALVLSGIPVAYRSKIWSECTGASALRIPGYYEDLVAASTLDSFDPEVTSQIQADIHRTLTDNVFFRQGPGVSKLREVLLAYAKRNPDVGYCQGMNLITGSLLLIMPTAEDAFWILVAMIENILPSNYYDHGLVGSRADQVVLRGYVSEVLPKLGAHLDELSVELEALTFQWFLSVFTDCLSAEALYRVWDVVLCLNSTSSASPGPTHTSSNNSNGKADPPALATVSSITTSSSTSLGTAAMMGSAEADSAGAGTGSGSTFLFQLALALLKLNEYALLTCDGPAAVYSYINHEMTNHAISIDGLIQASEGLRATITKDDVLKRRRKAVDELTGQSDRRNRRAETSS